MNHREVDRLLGSRWVADFYVKEVGGVPEGGREEDRRVTLVHMGEPAVISLGELWTLIEGGFVVEGGVERRH